MALSNTAQLVLNCLAVGGAFLVGHLVAAFLINAADRTLFRRKTPLFVHRAVRLLSGIALAIFVAGMLFGHGAGWHLFGGGGADGGGPADGNGPPQLISADVSPPPAPKTAAEPTPGTIVVTIFGGGDVIAERFYQLGDDLTLRNFSELKELIPARKVSSLEIRFSSKNILPVDHPAVTRLVRWARETANLNVTLPSDAR